MGSINWTDRQLGVINSIDGNTLVSASAGSGKTAVMLERVMRLITGESGKARVPLKRIVMVTFNESVAAELKSKISSRLSKKIAQSEDKDYLRAQIEDVPLADISTMHSFCSGIIKNNFEYLGVQPSFAIVDENEKDMLFGKALANVLKEYKEDYDYQMDMLINYFGGERGFCDTIVALYGFLESQLDREDCLNRLAFLCYDGEFKDSPLAKAFIDIVKADAAPLIEEGEEKLALFTREGMAKRQQHISLTLQMLRGIANAKDVKELAGYLDLLPRIETVPRSKKDDDVDKSIGEDYKAYNSRCKEFIFGKLKDKMFSQPYDVMQENIFRSRGYVERLVDVLGRVAKEYAGAKIRDNKMDFADLEYYAVKAMQNDMIAKDTADCYDYICVDEYQDINAVQEYILSRLSNGKNLFMVGDVKQSIYQFRLTDPQIFLTKYRAFQRDPSLGSAHALNDNYRSCKEVIDFVNIVFDNIMTRDLGGIDYRRESRLTQGNKDYLPQEGKAVRIAHFAKEAVELDIPVGEDGVYSVRDDADASEEIECREGNYIAAKIRELVGKKQIQVPSPDGGMIYRKVRFSDIALLCAKRSVGVERIVATLKSAGIPIDGGKVLKEKQNSCIDIMTSFLRVLDNHRQDIPLTEVLTGNIFARFNYKDMALIRSRYRKEKFFHSAVEKYRDGVDDCISAKLKEFFATLCKYRKIASFMTVDELMRRIIADFDFKAKMSATEGGIRDFVGLERFINSMKSKAYNSSVSKFIDAVDHTVDFGKVSSESGIEGDCVRTDTIHKSKGLEYPIVFIVDAAKQLNLSDVNAGNVLYDKTYGFAIKDIDEADRFFDDSLPIKIMRTIKTKSAIEEFMRLFYVTLTRARNMLFVTATGNVSRGNSQFGEKKVNGPLSMLQWLNNVAVDERDFCDRYFDKDADAPYEEETGEIAPCEKGEIDIAKSREFVKALELNYAHKSSTTLLVKHTVTAINNAYYLSQFPIKDASEHDKESLIDEIKDCDIGEEETIEFKRSADEGIAYHRVLECIDYECYTQDDVEAQLDLMAEQGLLSQEQRDMVDPTSILECLQSDVMANARAYPHYREKQFMLNIPADEILDVDSKDKVLLQGTVDLFIQGSDRGGENIIVDFKFSHKTPDRIKARYSRQLDLYAMAVEECLGVKVDKKVIFILGQNKTVEI